MEFSECDKNIVDTCNVFKDISFFTHWDKTAGYSSGFATKIFCFRILSEILRLFMVWNIIRSFFWLLTQTRSIGECYPYSVKWVNKHIMMNMKFNSISNDNLFYFQFCSAVSEKFRFEFTEAIIITWMRLMSSYYIKYIVLELLLVKMVI